MEELKKWALGVCAAAIFSSVVYALVPKGNMQKIMRCVAAAAVICALVFPLANALIKTDFSLDSSEILSSCGYPDCEIDLLTDIDESGGIFIKKANIILPSGAVINDAAVERLQKLLGDAVIDIRSGSESYGYQTDL